MTPQQAQRAAVQGQTLSAAEEAVVRSVLYSSLFDYPLTLAQLRESLMTLPQTASELRATLRHLASRGLVEEADRFIFPPGCRHLVDVRRQRETRSDAFLSAHRPLLMLIARLPFVRAVALSGSIAHRNLDAGGDLDLFIVARGATVWMVTVLVLLLAKLLRKRQTLCANFVISDRALQLPASDFFTANQVIGLKPVAGLDGYRQFIDANSFVKRFYPNFHPVSRLDRRVAPSASYRRFKKGVEWLLAPAAWGLERVCRFGYRGYLRKRAATWTSPDQVVLDNLTLKLHTRSHRQRVISRYAHLMERTLN